MKNLTEVFIGHGNLVYQRHKIGLAESLLCGLCGEDNETSSHILCYCPAIRDKGQILTDYWPSPLPFETGCRVAPELLVGDATRIPKHQGTYRVPAIVINNNDNNPNKRYNYS